MLDPSVMVEMNIDVFSHNKNVKSISYIYIYIYSSISWFKFAYNTLYPPASFVQFFCTYLNYVMHKNQLLGIE